MDISKAKNANLFRKWLLGKETKEDISAKYGVSNRTLSSWFQPFWKEIVSPKIVNVESQVLIIDGKYIEREAAVLVACNPDSAVSWSFVDREKYRSWRGFLESLSGDPLAIVCDGQKGMIKAIKQVFPQAIIQRCHFHIIQYCLARLTKKPKSWAAYDLRRLVIRVSKVKTKRDLKLWLNDYISWHHIHIDYVQEKTIHEHSLTPTGRKRWSYTHGKLHAANSHLRNSLPNLFTYLKHPQIPNTTNFVEGGINAQMQEKIRFHRGLDLQKRQILISHFLASKQE